MESRIFGCGQVKIEQTKSTKKAPYEISQYSEWTPRMPVWSFYLE
ncbi:hypothetical protein GCM10025794_27210 [Massilia kyonggiensis]